MPQIFILPDLAVVLFLFDSSSSYAATTLPADVCAALTGEDFSTLVDAPTQITASKLVDGVENIPAYCQVQGYVSPQVGFEIRLPAVNWNGKFLYTGCGGSCGFILESYSSKS